MRDVVGDGEAPAVAADEDGDDERAASEAEFDRHRYTGYRDGDGAEDDAEGDAEEEFGDVRDLQVALGVAEGGDSVFEVGASPMRVMESPNCRRVLRSATNRCRRGARG